MNSLQTSDCSAQVCMVCTPSSGAKTVEMVDREAYLLLFVSTASYPKRYEDVQLRLTSTCFASDLWDSGHFHAEVKAEIWIC